MSEEEQTPALIVKPQNRCPNCDSELQGQFCFSCGQNQKPPDRFFFHILNEALEGVFSVNSRAARTLFNLLFRPGFLTTEYFAGRRARYVQPLRLYLITSIVFFFFLSMQNLSYPQAENITSSDEFNERDTTELHTKFDSSLDNFHIDFLSPAQNQSLAEAIRSQTNKAIKVYEENPGEFADELIELIPQIMFFLLPIFAILLKVFYFTSARYYTEHLILAVHNHCFLFTALLLSEVLELLSTTLVAVLAEPLDIALNIWILIYMYWSLRVAYGQGLMLTGFKYIFLGIGYFFLFLIGLLAAFIWGVMVL